MLDRWTDVILVLALALGVAGDLLLRAVPWGVNLPIWVAVAGGVAAVVLALRARPGGRAATTCLLASAGFACGVAWRDAPALVALNFLAAGGLLVLGLLAAGGRPLGATSIGVYLWDSVIAVARLAFDPLVVVAARPQSASGVGLRRLRAVGVGVILTVPLLFVFGALLTQADPLFERAVRSLFEWDYERLASHLVLTGVIGWLACGYLAALVPPSRPAPPGSPAPRLPPGGWLGLLELAIPLGALAVLFGVFVGMQVGYFFGGEGWIRATAGLTYAEYARRGFFELVTVTALVVPLLIAADAVLDRSVSRATVGFRILATTLLVLVALIAVSAMFRLRLYYVAYGLTETRVYAGAAMLWVLLVLAWFAATVLRGKRGPFVLGALGAALVVLVGLNLLNPDALAARTNVARGVAGAELDVAYLGRLSGDAVPALAEAARALPPAQGCPLFESIRKRWEQSDAVDWRTWNLGRARARGAARDLATVACPLPAATEPAPPVLN